MVRSLMAPALQLQLSTNIAAVTATPLAKLPTTWRHQARPPCHLLHAPGEHKHARSMLTRSARAAGHVVKAAAAKPARKKRKQNTSADGGGDAADADAASAVAAAAAPTDNPSSPQMVSASPPGSEAPPSPYQRPPEVTALLEKAERIAYQLQGLYPRPPIPLDHSSTFQLLVAVILSAQSTDKKVNEITPALFKAAPDAHAMAIMKVDTIQGMIRAIGLAPTKAKNLLAMSKMLLENHGGQVPNTFEELEKLPGVGHKTASVIMTQAFGQPALPVDTHIHRLAQRWGLTCGRSVEQTEADLKLLFPEDRWHDLHLQMIYFGREHCAAKAHDPMGCPICSWAAVAPYNRPGVSPLKPGQKRRG